MEIIRSEEAIPDLCLSKFLYDMMPTKLSWRVGSKDKRQLVFWSQEASTNWTFQERIVNALCSWDAYSPFGVLIQFWAAEIIGGRRYLTTTLQPFSLSRLIMDGNFIYYRKICVGNDVFVEDDENNMDGIIGRVFRNQLPETSSDLSSYSVTDYPQRDLTLSCGFTSILVLPVFEPSERCCVGVLELLSRGCMHRLDINNVASAINSALKEQDLETVAAWEICNQVRHVRNAHEDYEEKQMAAALAKVCKELPNVNTPSAFEVLQYGEVLQSDRSIDQQLVREDIDVLEQPKIAINSEKKSSCSRKDLEQLFGKKLTDAAEILEVSRSTFKRLCREHNISRWPSHKRSKRCSLSSTPQQKNVVSQANVELISQDVERDLLCSEPASNLGLMSTTNKITVKATYGEKLFMFRLSYSSRMEDLVKKVIDRTKLGEGTFDITYLDEENDRISFACDEDLLDCMEGKSTIRLQIEPIATISPLNLVRSKSQHFSASSNFIDQFPCHMHDYIENITDVSGDGHCGFQAVAGVLGLLGLSTDDWGSVRAQLWKELNSHQELYTKVFIEHGRVEKVLASLRFFNSPAPKEYWFELPEMGYLVASVYDVALVCLNKQMSFTYLPLRTSRPNNSKLISIGFINNDHYVQLMLRENTPLPPVPANWYSHHHSCAATWLDYYSGRLEMYKLMADSVTKVINRTELQDGTFDFPFDSENAD